MALFIKPYDLDKVDHYDFLIWYGKIFILNKFLFSKGNLWSLKMFCWKVLCCTYILFWQKVQLKVKNLNPQILFNPSKSYKLYIFKELTRKIRNRHLCK